MRLDAPLHLPPGFNPEHVQFYNIEIARLADGMISVAVTVTTCPREEELATQELHCERAQTLDEVLAIVRNSVLLQ